MELNNISMIMYRGNSFYGPFEAGRVHGKLAPFGVCGFFKYNVPISETTFVFHEQTFGNGFKLFRFIIMFVIRRNYKKIIIIITLFPTIIFLLIILLIIKLRFEVSPIHITNYCYILLFLKDIICIKKVCIPHY